MLRLQGFEVRGIFVDFGQAAVREERGAVRDLQQCLSINVGTVRASSSVAFGPGELLGRNAFLIFAAILMGQCDDGLLAIGIHAGTPYYDCSPAFLEKVDLLVRETTSGRIAVTAPLLSIGRKTTSIATSWRKGCLSRRHTVAKLAKIHRVANVHPVVIESALNVSQTPHPENLRWSSI